MLGWTPFRKRGEESIDRMIPSFQDVLAQDWLSSFHGAALSFKTDIQETEKAYRIAVELPGFPKEDIDIRYEAPYLVIQAVRSEEATMEDSKHHIIRKEHRFGKYMRRLYMPGIDEHGIAASLKRGVLQLEVPKLAQSRAKRIQIRDDHGSR
ncbi:MULTISPECIES: Hsp20/alpha crystallin family protein [Paenibacillus]|uniref:Hsp20 family protein n=1 Tax=Paenibacillus campinasensis TaxID=66347 RepID=A0ABW9SWS7_9BACL|nr:MULTISPECIES: Hsp20/alpha crystallin family protein [Paenibacillus]MUG65122.1 Hsp20 family protein [Paenibacillus campinasensis]PAK52321.1 heat-shock protein Hsp20 [Paenibacillus sp. 7541]